MAFNPRAASFNPREGLEAGESSSQGSKMPSMDHNELSSLNMSSGDVPTFRSDQPMYSIGASQNMTGTSSQYNTFPSDRMSTATSRYPQQQFTPDARRTVTLDDLSKGLALPSAQQLAECSGPLESFPQQTFGTLDSNLITMALGKALTADVLAEYLQTQNGAAMSARAAPFHQAQRTVAGPETPDRALRETIKIVHPPPGFSNEVSRRISVDRRSSVDSRVALPDENLTNSTASRISRARTLSQPLDHSQHQPLLPGGRRMRSYSRTKRTDQGPEPSAADVYPDDANWARSQAESNTGFLYNGAMLRRQSSGFHPSPRRPLRMNDVFTWPTAAEVPDPASLIVAPAYLPALKPILETNNDEELGPATKADMDSADEDVIATINELPLLSVPTMLRLGVFNLTCNDHPLTSSQEDGSHYGMRFGGLAVGDPWLPTEPKETDWSNVPVADKAKTVPVADKAKTVPVVDEPKTIPMVDRSKAIHIVDRSKTDRVVARSRIFPMADKSKATPVTDKPKTVKVWTDPWNGWRPT